ncbi:MAG TPA: hydroxyacylglutathione hydrolase [Sedimentisphaerales bacterium]|nr:hydroxyacylglutathione hydrolase [Sedimentisphaerales bacterium]
MGSVITISGFGDNFIYLYEYDRGSAFAVDPGDGPLVARNLSRRNLCLTMILLTHHHWDHVGGVAELKRTTGCRVIGGDKQRIPAIDGIVGDGELLAVGNIKIQVIATPGHTRTALCYYMPPCNDRKNGILWTGDTLFVGGCGRLLECHAESMWDSLQKLASLPETTQVFPGHDYTVENYEFALSIEPDNQAVRHRLQQLRQAQRQGMPTVPSTILQEKMTNPFLRAADPQMKMALNMPRARAVDVFAELRRRKDFF